jgi:branched-chain amino acid transport system permease protein
MLIPSKERKKHLVTLLGIGVLFLGLMALDHTSLVNSYIRTILLQTCFTIIVVTSLNLTLGFLGQLALGHAGFMAIGAYTSALVTKAMLNAIKAGQMAPMPNVLLFAIGLIAGALMAAVFGLLVGIPALRLRGDYLAIITLGFGEIIRVIIQNLPMAGGKGLSSGQAGQALIGIMKMNDLYLIFWIMVACVAAMYCFVRSKYGRAIMSIREDDIAASSVGINTTFYKVLTFTLSAFFAGIAGAIFAHRGTGTLQPGDFTFMRSTEMVIMVVLGGMGSMTGSIAATIILTALPELLRSFGDNRMLVYSIVLVVVMIFRPTGLAGSYEFSLYRSIFERRRKPDAADAKKGGA